MEYRQLSRELGEIRLLNLVTDKACDRAESVPLRCSLEHASLSSAIDYVALSYLWGDSKDTVPLLVDGNQIAITRNLANALDYLQRIGIARVWADAICINQEDENERATQIQRMGAIYHAASFTYSWLPIKDDCHSAETLSSLKIIQDANFGSILDLRRTLYSLGSLFNNPYWRRVWILQEVALSKRVKLIYGSHILPLVNLETLMNRASGAENRNLSIQIDGFQHVRNVVDICSRVRLDHPIQLVEALAISSRSESTEMRDRVYGLWGLAFNAKNYLPEPSYTQSLEQLCLAMTRAHIESTRSLDIIPTLALELADPRGPSWVADWFRQETWLQATSSQLLPCSIPGLSHKWKPRQDVEGYLDTTDVGVKPWPYPLPWSAHNFVPVDCSYDAAGTVLMVKGRILGTVHNCTGTFDGLPGPSNLGASLFVEWPRMEIWRALFYLFTLEYATEWIPPETKGDSIIRANSLKGKIAKYAPRFVLFLHHVLLMKSHRTAARYWIARNASFDIFGARLSMAVKVPMLVWTLICIDFIVTHIPLGFISMAAAIPIYISTRFLLLGLFFSIFGGVCLVVAISIFLMELLFVVYVLRNLRTSLKSKGGRIAKILELNKRLATGTFGIGWVHNRVVPGDSIAILTGCSVPLVLRSNGNDGWIVVGDAIVYKAMDGEMMDRTACEYLEIH